MAAIGNVSVTSAAIIEGSLIIGLSDGSIINCGYVQGPQGLKGDRGPMGATGERGTDGATIHTTKGPPPADLGKDGDYAINNRDWFIFGPKASGMWGAGQGMLPKDIHQPVFGGSSNQGGGPIGGSDGGGGGGTSGPVFTSQVIATGSGRLKPDSRGTKRTVNYPGSANGIISPSGDMNFQSNINGWIVDALDELEGAIPVPVVDLLPDAGQYDGQLVLFEGSLYIWAGGAWTKVSADGGGVVIDTIPPVPAAEGQLWFNNSEDELTLYIYDGAAWVPASPPVSLDGINAAIANVDEELMKVNANIAMNKRDIDEAILDVREDQERQDEKIAELEGEVDDLKPTVERGEWIYNSDPENKNNPEVGEYHAYVVVSDDYCKSKLSECLLNAAGDPTEASKCNRDNEDCLAEIGNIDTDVPWHDVEWLVVHRNDVEGRNHTFGDVVAGMYIEAINVDGTGHGLYTITGKSLSPTRCGFQVTPVHSTGHPKGKAVIKIFKMAEAANPDDYVMKSGDTMTGKLETTDRIWIRPDGQGPVGTNNMLVVNQKDADSGSIARFQKDGSDVVKVENGGDLSLCGNRIKNLANPQYELDGANKKYVDDKVAKGSTHEGGTIPANLVLWEYVEGGKDAIINLASNQFTVEISGSNLTMYVAAHAHGRFYVPGRTANYSHEIGHTFITINEYDSSCVLGAKATKLWLMQKESKGDKSTWYNAVDCSYYKPGLEAHPLVAGRRYVLSLPSPFPLFAYSREYFLNGTTTTQSSDDSIEEVAPDAIDLGEIHP